MVILAICLFAQIYFVSAFTQSASSIIVNVDGTARNLGEGNGVLGGTTYASATTTSGQHDASQVWVSVLDGEMTLLQALQSTNKLKPNPSKPTTYASSPSDKTKPYHFANQVMIDSTKTLQQAINDGKFVGINGGWCPWDYTTCSSKTCGVSGTMTTTCECPAPSNGGLECLINANTGERGLTKIGYCTPSNCPPTPTYSWFEDWNLTYGGVINWTRVDACVQRRTYPVVCKRNDGVIVSASYCTGTKPTPTDTCSACKWVPDLNGMYVAVEKTKPYCSSFKASSCVSSTRERKEYCKTDGGNCWSLWCDGQQIICKAFPRYNYCS